MGRGIFGLLAVALGCAGSIVLPEHVVSLRSQLDQDAATRLVARHAQWRQGRGGLCLMGLTSGATLEQKAPISASSGKLRFTGRYSKAGLLVGGMPTNGNPDEIEPYSRKLEVDLRTLREIRILDRRLENLRRWCPNVADGYLIVVKPRRSLPYDAEASINVLERSALDEVLAALTYFSPEARIVGGSGL